MASFVIYLAVNQRFGVYYNILIGPSTTPASAPSSILGLSPNSALGNALKGIW